MHCQFYEHGTVGDISRNFILELIRQNIKESPLLIRAVFELSYFTPISNLELINLNISDINFETRTVKVTRGNETPFIPITDKCLSLLWELGLSASEYDAPLFLNSKGERISLSNLWFIKRSFSIETDFYL